MEFRQQMWAREGGKNNTTMIKGGELGASPYDKKTSLIISCLQASFFISSFQQNIIIAETKSAFDVSLKPWKEA